MKDIVVKMEKISDESTRSLCDVLNWNVEINTIKLSNLKYTKWLYVGYSDAYL